jgi:uracil-DNA glycosylase
LPRIWGSPCKIDVFRAGSSTHGGNRVGRIFKGDESARFLFAACLPQNKPLGSETKQRKSFLIQEIAELKNLKAILALGQLAFQVALPFIGEAKGEKFTHGLHLSGGRLDLFASFHPSPQNTYRGKLTKPMLVGLLRHIQAVVF